MKLLIPFFVITAAFHMISSAPTDHIQQYELSMLNKLHRPWFTPDKPPVYPRKGEYPCKGGICKTKIKNCEDCQYAVPLE